MVTASHSQRYFKVEPHDTWTPNTSLQQNNLLALVKISQVEKFSAKTPKIHVGINTHWPLILWLFSALRFNLKSN